MSLDCAGVGAVATVTLHFTSGPIVKPLSVPRSSSLRSMQSLLCCAFGQRFPMMQAYVTCRGDKYDDFSDEPFTLLLPGEGVAVEFVQTDNPYFYDVSDRQRPIRITLEEEVAYEKECDEAGDDESLPPLADWVLAHRFGSLSLSPAHLLELF